MNRGSGIPVKAACMEHNKKSCPNYVTFITIAHFTNDAQLTARHKNVSLLQTLRLYLKCYMTQTSARDYLKCYMTQVRTKVV